MTALTKELLARIARRPQSAAKAAIWDRYVADITSAEGAAVLAHHKVSDEPIRLAAFLGNVLHEAGGLTIVREYMSYRAERLMQVWPRWFPTLQFARQYEHQPEKLANYIYGTSTTIGNNLGNLQPGDGWRYRGGGLLQTTGRHGYRNFGKKAGIDLEGQPDLIEVPLNSLKAGLAEWSALKLNDYADKGNFKACCNGINRGNPNATANPIGWDDRRAWYAICRKQLGIKVLAEIEEDFDPRTLADVDSPEFDELPRGRDTEVGLEALGEA